MIIYEVNLTIDNEIITEYQSWLISHVQEILKINGFCSAEIATEILADNTDLSKTNITVRYYIENQHDLDLYFKNHATQMRNEGIEKFGNKFSASRRIFQDRIKFQV